MPKIWRILLFISPFIFAIVFLSLISYKGTINPILKNSVLLFLLICAVVFIISLIIMIGRLIRAVSTKLQPPNKQPAGVYPTRLELIIRKVLAVLIIIIGIAFGFWFTFYVPLAILAGLYIFFRKRYFLVTDILLLPIGAFLYYLNFPLLGPDPKSMKLLIVGVSAGPILFIFFVGKILILVAGIILVVSGILSKFKIFRDSPRRGLFIFCLFIVVAGGLIVPPVLQPIRVILNGQGGQFSENCGPGEFPFPNDTNEVTVDAFHKVWTYHWSAKNILGKQVTISEITGAKPGPKLLGLLQLLPEEITIAPPFGQQIEVSGAQKSATGINVEPGATLDMRIISPVPLYGLIMPINNNCRLAYGFLMPGRDVESISEALDPQIRFYTTNARISSPSPVEQTTFLSGKTIYPVIIGIKEGIVFGLQIINQSGQSFIPLDIDHPCISGREGTTEGCGGEFNNANQPFNPGTYEIQLIKVMGAKGLIIAKTQFVVTASK